MSVSPPFCSPSAHVASQISIKHEAPAQSALLPHGEPAGHFAGQTAPQSTPASAPFQTPSKHDGAAHAPLSQTPLRQSPPPAQLFVFSQGEHAPPPPQSMSVSAPFFTPSEHAGSAQTRATQTPLAQWSPAVQSMHAPAPSHACPPPSSQGAPIGSLSMPQSPSKQRGPPH
jgi:hypothetical protein